MPARGPRHSRDPQRATPAGEVGDHCAHDEDFRIQVGKVNRSTPLAAASWSLYLPAGAKSNKKKKRSKQEAPQQEAPPPQDGAKLAIEDDLQSWLQDKGLQDGSPKAAVAEALTQEAAGVPEVAAVLHKVNLAHLIAPFAEQEVDMCALMVLDSEMMTEMGVADTDAAKLLSWIQEQAPN